jgi:hypothetical protein
MKKLLTNVLVAFDFCIILLKVVIFFHYLILVETTNSSAKEAYSFYLFPLIFYGVINVIRLFRRANRYIIFFELLLNFIFIFIYYHPHQLIYLVLTVISLFINYCEIYLKRHLGEI